MLLHSIVLQALLNLTLKSLLEDHLERSKQDLDTHSIGRDDVLEASYQAHLHAWIILGWGLAYLSSCVPDALMSSFLCTCRGLKLGIFLWTHSITEGLQNSSKRILPLNLHMVHIQKITILRKLQTSMDLMHKTLQVKNCMSGLRKEFQLKITHLTIIMVSTVMTCRIQADIEKVRT